MVPAEDHWNPAASHLYKIQTFTVPCSRRI